MPIILESIDKDNERPKMMLDPTWEASFRMQEARFEPPSKHRVLNINTYFPCARQAEWDIENLASRK